MNPPRLNFSQVGSFLVISWPAYETGFTLQSASAIASQTIWATAASTPTLVGSDYIVTNSTATGKSFYRLSSP